jgi:hypothetical protein
MVGFWLFMGLAVVVIVGNALLLLRARPGAGRGKGPSR